MSGFLSALAARALGQGPTLGVRVRSIFEPESRDALAPLEEQAPSIPIDGSEAPAPVSGPPSHEDAAPEIHGAPRPAASRGVPPLRSVSARPARPDVEEPALPGIERPAPSAIEAPGIGEEDTARGAEEPSSRAVRKPDTPSAEVEAARPPAAPDRARGPKGVPSLRPAVMRAAPPTADRKASPRSIGGKSDSPAGTREGKSKSLFQAGAPHRPGRPGFSLPPPTLPGRSAERGRPPGGDEIGEPTSEHEPSRADPPPTRERSLVLRTGPGEGTRERNIRTGTTLPPSARRSRADSPDLEEPEAPSALVRSRGEPALAAPGRTPGPTAAVAGDASEPSAGRVTIQIGRIDVRAVSPAPPPPPPAAPSGPKGLSLDEYLQRFKESPS